MKQKAEISEHGTTRRTKKKEEPASGRSEKRRRGVAIVDDDAERSCSSSSKGYRPLSLLIAIAVVVVWRGWKEVWYGGGG